MRPRYYLYGNKIWGDSFIFTFLKFYCMRRLVIALLFVPLITIAQKKQITLEDIYKNRIFQADKVPAFSELPLDSIINPGDVKDEKGKQLNSDDYQVRRTKRELFSLQRVNPSIVVLQKQMPTYLTPCQKKLLD